jgi:hypothetical protein
MASAGVYFAGKQRVKPGAYSQVDAQNMVPLSNGDSKVLAILGEADSGEPQKLLWANDPANAKAALRGGDLLDLANIAWAPSANITENPGADLIALVRVNKGTQATTNIGTSITLTSVGYDVRPYKYGIDAGEGGGWVVTLTDGESTETSPEVSKNNDAVVAWINANSKLITASKTSETAIVATSGLVAFTTVGTSPTATSEDWQTAIDLLAQDKRIQGVVLASTDETIHAYAKTAIDTASSNRKERRLFVGHEAGETADQVLTRAANFASSRACLASPGIKRLKSDGTLASSPMYLAAAAAGMWAGGDPKEPLTFKYIGALGIDKVYTDPDEIEKLVAGGVLVVEQTNSGYRIVQGVTTYTADQNILYRELSVSTLADLMAREMRDEMEGKVVGRARTSTDATSVYNRAISKLNQFVKRGWLIGDEIQGIAPYRNVSLYRVGLGWGVEYEGSPAEPNNFVLISSHYRSLS